MTVTPTIATSVAQFGDTDLCQLTICNSPTSSNNNEYQYGALHYSKLFLYVLAHLVLPMTPVAKELYQQI